MEQKIDLSVECFREEVMERMQQIYIKLGDIENRVMEKLQVLNKLSPDKDVSYQNKRNAYLSKLNNFETLTPKKALLSIIR